MDNNKKILILVFLLGTFLRFFKLTEYPVHLSMDEANIAINAYSILKNGHDEWGNKLPLAFESVGDYKPPINIYLTSISILIFGYNEFAIRFPTAFFSVLSLFAIASILSKLGLNGKSIIAGTFFMAVSPWHIKFSRSGFEAITALTLMLYGLSFFLSWRKDLKYKNIFLSILFFSLSVWTYHAQRVFVPILFTFLVIQHLIISNAKIRIKTIRQLLTTFLFLSPIIIPFIYLTFFTQAIKARASTTSFLRDQSLQKLLSNQSAIVKLYLIFQHWIGKYLDYFDIRFLFFKGLELTPNHHPDIGLLYLVELPMIAIGVANLYKSNNDFNKKLVFFWLITGIIPASLTINNLHPLRSLTWLPAFVLLFSYAFNTNTFFHGLFKILILPNIIYFFIAYTILEPYHLSEYRQYGQKQFSQYICLNKHKYDHIKITDTFGSDGPLNTGVPYVYYLFYCQIDPKDYQKRYRNFDQIIYSRPNWKFDKTMKNTLLIGSPWDFIDERPPKENIVDIIKFLNGKEAYLLVETSLTPNEIQ